MPDEKISPESVDAMVKSIMETDDGRRSAVTDLIRVSGIEGLLNAITTTAINALRVAHERYGVIITIANPDLGVVMISADGIPQHLVPDLLKLASVESALVIEESAAQEHAEAESTGETKH